MKRFINLLFIIFIMIISINSVKAQKQTDQGILYDVKVRFTTREGDPIRNSLICLYDREYVQMACYRTNHEGNTMFNVYYGKYFIRQETVIGDYIQIERFDIKVEDDMYLEFINDLYEEEVIEEEPIIEEIKEEIIEEPIIEEIEEDVIEEVVEDKEISVIEEEKQEEIPIIIEDKKEEVIEQRVDNTIKSVSNTKKSVKTAKNSQKKDNNELLAMNYVNDSDNKGALVYSESKENDKTDNKSQSSFYLVIIAFVLFLIKKIISKFRVKKV